MPKMPLLDDLIDLNSLYQLNPIKLTTSKMNMIKIK
jgi:hypothetical protein